MLPLTPPTFRARIFAPLAFLLLATSLCHAEPPKAVEPTNAAEAAAKKAAADAEIDAQYQALVAKLPPEQQAWERTLQENLGSFYLPIHKREKVRGTSNAWDFVADDPKLPRVLLIGDSVSRGYTQAVRKELAGKVNVHRAPANCGPTASGLKNLEVWLGDPAKKWDLIHFNFGIHDRKTAPEVYEQNLEQLVTRMAATGAKLVWASTTPVPPDTKDGAEVPAAIVEKNKIAAKVMRKHGVVIDDLYAWMQPDLAKFQNPQDVHFSAAGYDRLAQRVARVVETALPAGEGVNPATVPVGKLEMDGYNWEDRHAAVMTVKDQIEPEIVLIGDSITHFWGGQPDDGKARGREAWAALFGERKVLNLGFGWDRTQNVLKRIELGELDGLDPKVIVIHIGTNNLAGTPQARAATPAQIAEGITAVVDRAQAKCPNAKVILMAVFPRGKDATNPHRTSIAEINRLLAPLAQKSRVTLLDITDRWLAPDGSVSTDLMPDSLHPNEKGYGVWSEALRPLLSNP
jgi:lysophospholipase L1-like esterase